MAMTTADGLAPIALEGARSARGNLTRARIRWVIAALLLIFGVVGARLVQLGMVVTDTTIEGQARDIITATRPAILDRNGLEMAVDIRVPSLFADPRAIAAVGVDTAVEALRSVMPELDADWLRKRLSGDKGFVWIQREVTPALQEKIMSLGIPGLDFVTESKRFYPGGSDAAHILGAVNIDNQGIAGIEKHMDDEGVALLQSIGLARGNELAPVQLSIDMRVQHVMHDQLADSLKRYRADAAAGVMLDIKTGEVIGLVSLPDFDPNNPVSALQKGTFNRVTSGIFEMGSSFKTITIAGAIDSGKVRINDIFDARYGIRFGRFTIDDFHGKHRMLSVPEIYKYSSNIGAIRVMQAWGKDNFRDYITKIGLDKRLSFFELPELRDPDVPKTFSEVVAATASFGHGLSITPLHMAMVYSGFVNDGCELPPTLYKRSLEQAQPLCTQIVSPRTSQDIRYLMRLNALEGSGTRMNMWAKGYRAGGKTGTAEKVVNGHYATGANFNVFGSAFPLDDPRYVMVVIVDNPHAENAQSGTTAGWNAGEVSGRIIGQAAPLLGVSPSFDDSLDIALTPPELR
jgi:cell division protein FtsI (penicillin-binding protein 3)